MRVSIIKYKLPLITQQEERRRNCTEFSHSGAILVILETQSDKHLVVVTSYKSSLL